MRNETDALGQVKVPADSYSGSFATRAADNFRISALKAPQSYREALVWIKMSAANVNTNLGHLDEKVSNAIQEAGEEFIAGKYAFDLDAYQAGAGTSYNMQLNEILANRANEILGGEKGKYDLVHPNNHVNMAQSSNDVTPTAIRIAALGDMRGLFSTGNDLMNAFEAKAGEYKGIVKVGRTHLQDAVPVTLGQEFGAYASSIRHCLARLQASQTELMELGIGATAIGSGINTHPEFSDRMCKSLSEFSGLSLSPAPNKFETTHSMAPFLALSSSLRSLAVELLRICNDLRLMSSGPKAGLGEISLPEVQPGSSIMPGKINPSILECMSMICVQVIGMDHSINLSAQQGQFELNWYTPLIMWDLLHQIEILSNGMYMLNIKCIVGIEADEERMNQGLIRSTAFATALAPHLGYAKVADLVHEAVQQDVRFESLVPAEYKKYLELDSQTKPNRK